MKIRKKNNHFVQQLSWNSDVYRLRNEENTAYKNFLAASSIDKVNCLSILKTAKKNLKIAIRSAAQTKLNLLIRDIEALRSKDPREYWKRLYALDNSQQLEDKLPVLVKNSSGILVGGAEAHKIWSNSFSKLGLESTDFDEFDSKFYYEIKQTVENHIPLSFDVPQISIDKPI